MRMQQFIQTYRSELNETISKARDFVPRTASCFCHRNGTDHYHSGNPVTVKDCREWILNDEGLYRWARAEGVRI